MARHYCRNPRCRMKLPTPVENEHHAFCTRACYESFYLTRCRVCERDLRKRDKETGKPRLVQAGRLYCRPPNKCRLEASKHVSRYDWGGAVAPRNRHPSEVAILRALKLASEGLDAFSISKSGPNDRCVMANGPPFVCRRSSRLDRSRVAPFERAPSRPAAQERTAVANKRPRTVDLFTV